MKDIILLKLGEIVLKGLNRRSFEQKLLNNARRKLRSCGNFNVYCLQSIIYVEPADDEADVDAAFEEMQKVFGVISLTRAAACEKTKEAIAAKAIEYLRDDMLAAKSFKVESSRSDKKFPLKSPELCVIGGDTILTARPDLKVDVNSPERTIMIEIRDRAAFVHGDGIKGAGGVPVSSSGRAMLMLSGGIDSPVAGYMMAKRGITLCGIHFASPPYTSERAEQKVVNLLQKLLPYTGHAELYVVPFTHIQEEIRDHCPEDLFTLVMRRFMMRCATRLAKEQDCEALITGESVGQVASQTIPAMACTEAVTDLPVFRPCIGLDKEEIVAISRKIGTFEISIEPYEDCCTVFTPRHPRTRPKLSMLEEAEQALDVDALVEEAVASAYRRKISF